MRTTITMTLTPSFFYEEHTQSPLCKDCYFRGAYFFLYNSVILLTCNNTSIGNCALLLYMDVNTIQLFFPLEFQLTCTTVSQSVWYLYLGMTWFSLELTKISYMKFGKISTANSWSFYLIWEMYVNCLPAIKGKVTNSQSNVFFVFF